MKQSAIESLHVMPDKLVNYLQLINADSNMPLGQIINILPNSLVMTSRLPVLVKAKFNFLINMPLPDNQIETIEFTAVCLWSRRDDYALFYDSGFEIISSRGNMHGLVSGLNTYFQFKNPA